MLVSLPVPSQKKSFFLVTQSTMDLTHPRVLFKIRWPQKLPMMPPPTAPPSSLSIVIQGHVNSQNSRAVLQQYRGPAKCNTPHTGTPL